MQKQMVLSKIEEVARRVGESEGIDIFEIELKGSGNSQLLRIYIDKPEGVTHGDCELISQQVGTILDVEDVIPGRYTLEVSSPGVERKLKSIKDFERFHGQNAKVVLREPVENQKYFEGKLSGIGDQRVHIELANGKMVEFPYEQVERANLKFDW